MIQSTLAKGALFALVAGSLSFRATAQSTRSVAEQILGTECTHMSGGGGVVDGPATTLEGVADGAQAIVEGFVQVLDPAPVQTGRGQESGIPRDEILFAVTRVLKGPDSLKQVFMSQIRAGGFFEMRPGRRFILFLDDVNPRAPQPRTEHPGVPRYQTAATLCIDEGTIRVNDNGGSLRTRYDGIELDRVVADIRAYLNLHRIGGRIADDTGAFPLEGLLHGIPADALDLKARLKIVLTPVESTTDMPPRTSMAVQIPLLRGGRPFSSVSMTADSAPRTTMIDRSGTFKLPVDKGVYRVSVEGLPFGYSLTSITYGGRDVMRDPLRVGAASSELRVTIARQPSAGASAGVKVRGRVTGIPDPNGAASLRLWVVMVSDAAENVRAGAVELPPDGSFEFLNVPPGRYALKTLPVGIPPRGIVWGQPSTLSMTVAGQDVPVELPAFARD